MKNFFIKIGKGIKWFCLHFYLEVILLSVIAAISVGIAFCWSVDNFAQIFSTMVLGAVICFILYIIVRDLLNFKNKWTKNAKEKEAKKIAKEINPDVSLNFTYAMKDLDTKSDIYTFTKEDIEQYNPKEPEFIEANYSIIEDEEV